MQIKARADSIVVADVRDQQERAAVEVKGRHVFPVHVILTGEPRGPHGAQKLPALVQSENQAIISTVVVHPVHAIASTTGGEAAGFVDDFGLDHSPFLPDHVRALGTGSPGREKEERGQELRGRSASRETRHAASEEHAGRNGKTARNDSFDCAGALDAQPERPMSPRLALLLVLGLVALPGASSAAPFAPTANSLRDYRAPSWFGEARFGIAVQWGVSSVPALDADYARKMYLPLADNPVRHYHEAHYGLSWIFGYKDLIPYWEGQNWRPAELARLFRDAGARYVVVLATDRDNFDLFPSPHQPWNSTRIGPHRDIVGDWSRELRAAGLRWGVAVQNARSWWFLRPAHGFDWDEKEEKQFFDGNLTKLDGADQWWEGLDPRALYGTPRPGDAFAPEPRENESGRDPAPPVYQENWYNRLCSLTDTYRPDLVWMRSTLPHGDWSLRWAARYYNAQTPEGAGGRTEAVLVARTGPSAPPTAHVPHLDAETPPPPAMPGVTRPWQREIQLARGGVRTGEPPALELLDFQRTLTTTLAAGGNLLLQVSLQSDGTLPATHRAFLEQQAAWLKLAAPALFESDPIKGWSVPDTAGFTKRNGKGWYVVVLNWKPGQPLDVPLVKARLARWVGGEYTQMDMNAERTLMRVTLPAAPVIPGLGILELVPDTP